MADALAAQAAQPRKVSIVFGLAQLDHVLKVDRKRQDLRNARQASAARKRRDTPVAEVP